MAGNIYQLKVTLRGIRPPIWRRLRVPGSISLDHLHSVFQIALGWTDSHLHQFRIGRDTFGVPDADEWGRHTSDERRVRLDRIATVRSKLTYDYDFGDDWVHDIVVERVDPAQPGEAVPVCKDGRRACPPEDCGGPLGYEDLVLALADPKNPEYEERLEWIGPDWQPEDFNIDQVNDDLRALGPRLRRHMPRRRLARSITRPAND